MPGTTSAALPSFSHDQHHKTDAAKRKGGGLGYDAVVRWYVRMLVSVMHWLQLGFDLDSMPFDFHSTRFCCYWTSNDSQIESNMSRTASNTRMCFACQALVMVKHVRRSFSEILQELTWLEDRTKTVAQEKVYMLCTSLTAVFHSHRRPLLWVEKRFFRPPFCQMSIDLDEIWQRSAVARSKLMGSFGPLSVYRRLQAKR